ncbi:MAG: hypothetical protein MN733_34750 [Nitrososphaera sp.]|nr:hypothetical protein [Nitrososphaera sp.]
MRNRATTYLDPSGLDFIAIGGRLLQQNLGGLLGHLSIEYWQTPLKAKLNESITREDLAKAAGACLPAPVIQSMEVMPDDRWAAWTWNLPVIKPPKGKKGEVQIDFKGKRFWQYTLVGIAYVRYDQKDATDLVPIFDGGGKNADVKDKWKALVELAKAYEYAEQPGYDKDIMGGDLKKWPKSYYIFPWNAAQQLEYLVTNNSNTFVRHLLTKAELGYVPPAGRLYPGPAAPSEISHSPSRAVWVYGDQRPWIYEKVPANKRPAKPANPPPN